MVTRWWVVLLASVLWDTVSLKPDNGKSECCPCPKDEFGNPLARSGPFGELAPDMAASGTSGAAARALDECPCRLRDADSVGAPSVFFPSAVRAMRPLVTLENSKENPDPLLHPEVNLASSVLETLRAATDEEYEQALARDAARSSADGEAAASTRNLVTVVINPKDAVSDDDVMSEASHVHEARCIQPLGRSLRTSLYKPVLLTDILNLPKRKSSFRKSWNLFDMDNEPSNINERVVNPTSKTIGGDWKPISYIPDLTTNVKPLSPLEKLSNFNRNSEQGILNTANSAPPKTLARTNLKIPSLSHLLPKYKTPNFLPRKEDDDIKITSDNQNAASIVKERYIDFTNKNKDEDVVKTKPLQTISRPSFKTPGIPNFIINTKPIDFKSSSVKNRDATTAWLNNLLKGLEVPNLRDLFSSDVFNLRNNDQATKSTEHKDGTQITPEKPFVTEIIDTVPSPTEIKSDHIAFGEVEQKNGANNDIITENEEIQKIIDQNPLKTEIIDQVPITSDETQNDNSQINIFSGSGGDGVINTVKEFNNGMTEINDKDINSDSIANESDKESQFVRLDDRETKFANENVGMNDNDSIIEGDTSQNERNGNQEECLSAESNLDEIQSTPLRENIKNSLDNLKSRSKINHNLINVDNIENYQSVPENNLIREQFKPENQHEEAGQLNTQILDTMPSEDSMGQVNISDLQQMSDTLLDKEKLREDALPVDNDAAPPQDIIDDFETNTTSGNVNTLVSDNDDLRSVDNTMQDTKESVNIISDGKILECFEKDVLGKSLINDNTGAKAKENEMVSEASEKVIEIVDKDNKLQSPFRQSIITQPLSLSDLNLFNLPALNTNLFNINSNLPALKIPDIFKSKDKMDEVFESHDDDIDEFETRQSMSPSTSSYRSVLPSLPPLEDINFNLLQLKPLGTELPTIPRLNLNSFKTKLAIPESLQLRPLVLESSVGNKKGAIGASFTFGNNDKKGIGRSNMLEQASLKKPYILGRPLLELPNLDELRNTMWENAQNLLNTPLETTSRNVVEDTLRSGQILTENFRVDAENKVKDIQRNLESTLKGVGLNDRGLLSSTSFKSPSDLLQEISRKHEDVNDKLKGLSYDLSDRLETFRSNLFDDYRLPSFRTNILDRATSLGSPSLRQTSFMKPQSKSSSYSSKAKKVAISKSSPSKGKFISRSSADKNKLKMPTAASMPAVSLKAVKSPSLRTSEPPMLKGLGKEPSRLKIISRDRPTLSLFPKTEKNIIDRPLFKKPSLPKFGQSKVKISFSTTPFPPMLKSKPRFKDFTTSKASLSKVPLTLPSLPKSPSRDRTALLSPFRDSSGFASEPVFSKVEAPLRAQKTLKDFKWRTRPRVATHEDEEKEKSEVTVYITTPKPKTDPPNLSGPKPPTLDKTYNSNSDHLSTDGNSGPKHPTVPKGKNVDSEPLRSQRRYNLQRTTKDFKLRPRPRVATHEDEEKEKSEVTVYITTPKPKTDPPNLSGPKPPTLDKTYISNSDHLSTDENSGPKHPTVPKGKSATSETLRSQQRRTSLSWPKTIDDKFLIRVKEALKARLAGITQLVNENVNVDGSPKSIGALPKIGKITDDMARSESNNVDVAKVAPQVLKENTSYNCKLMCTKNE